MKKLLAMILCLVMVLALAACNNGTPNNGDNSNGSANGGTPAAPGPNGATTRIGLGMAVDSAVSPAEDDDDGRAEAEVTTCALLLDQEGKILSVKFDCTDIFIIA